MTITAAMMMQEMRLDMVDPFYSVANWEAYAPKKHKVKYCALGEPTILIKLTREGELRTSRSSLGSDVRLYTFALSPPRNIVSLRTKVKLAVPLANYTRGGIYILEYIRIRGMWKFPLQIFPGSPEIIPAHRGNRGFTLCFKGSSCCVPRLCHHCSRRFSLSKPCSTIVFRALTFKKKFCA